MMNNVCEQRIKRANTDWWINEKAMVGMNGLTYIAYVTDMGEIHVKAIDAKCSRTPSRDVCLCRMNCNYADEHNAPSICVTDSGKIIVAYTGHAATSALRYRVTERPYDLDSFGPERVIPYEGSVTYAQLFENSEKQQLWLFTRVDRVTWEFRFSENEGGSWSEPNKFLVSESGGLFYLDVRKQLVRHPKKGVAEQWFFALYGHPRISRDHTIRSGFFDSDGQLHCPDGSTLGVNLYCKSERIDLGELSVVYESPEGTTVRLLAVSPTLPYRVGLASFVLDDADSAVYYSAAFDGISWRLSAPIARAGAFLAPGQTDGSQTYIPGMAYYYGVGEAGYHPKDGGDVDTNRIFVARADEEGWYLESYVSRDRGESYVLEKCIRHILANEGRKLWRPTVPVYAQDNLPVYWHEGTYTAHTGGWHSDAVMLVAYDD